MKRSHRRSHGLIWLALLPALLLVIVLADQSRTPPAPGQTPIKASSAGVLP
ncbi:MAG: hypothetical protein AAF529_09475 [Pseudomonadota bacterium]